MDFQKLIPERAGGNNKNLMIPGTVAHIYNSNYLGGLRFEGSGQKVGEISSQ
jgi:hypothetical protein